MVVILLVVGLHVIDRWIGRIARLPADAYADDSISLSMVSHSWAASGALAGMLVVLFAVPRFRAWRRGWGVLLGPSTDDSVVRDSPGSGLRLSSLRWVIGVTAAVLAWSHSTYDANFVVQQDHVFDRVLLVVLAVGAVWHPASALLFCCLVRGIYFQRGAPLDGFSASEPEMLVKILITAAAATLIASWRQRSVVRELCLVWCALVAAHYWTSGVGKIAIGWPVVEGVHFALAATHAHGWLGFLGADEIASAVAALSGFNWLLVLGTLGIECGAVLLLVRSSVSPVIGAMLILFHVGVFALTGICFWMWVALDACLLFCVLRPHRIRQLGLSRAGSCLGFVALVLTSTFWARPHALVWYDVPVAYSYEFTLEPEHGDRVVVPAHFFAPFDYQLTLGPFSYLAVDENLGIVFGSTRDRAIADALGRCATPEDVRAVEQELGKSRHSPPLANRFDAFVIAFFRGREAREGDRGFWTAMQAPPQLWTYARRPEALDVPLAVRRVVVTRVTTFFDGEQILEIGRELVRTVEIPR